MFPIKFRRFDPYLFHKCQQYGLLLKAKITCHDSLKTEGKETLRGRKAFTNQQDSMEAIKVCLNNTEASILFIFFRAKKIKNKNIMTTYHINPTVKKRWFKSPQIVYELIKYTEEEHWIDPTYGNGGGDFITVKKETVVFSSPSFEEVEELRNKLNQINKE